MTRNSVNFAWGFWHYRYKAYTTNKPHRGYDLLLEWMKAKKYGGFSFTSNIDGHWEACGLSSDRIVECHGSVRFLQCAGVPHSSEINCESDFWPVEKLEMEIDAKTSCAAEPHPTCKHCGGRARPNVMMFDDYSYISTRLEAQEKQFEQWLHNVQHNNGSIAVIEIGAGSAVPTVRLQSQAVLAYSKATLIRVNPEEPQIPKTYSSQHLSVKHDSLEFLEAVHDLLYPSSTSSPSLVSSSPSLQSTIPQPETVEIFEV